MKKKNRGFTLVELIVSMAILAIVGVGIGTVITQSMRQYQKSHTEVNLQQESQLVGNQLSNFVMAANDGVSTGTGMLNIYDYDMASKMRGKVVVSHNTADNTLLYTRYEKGADDEDWTVVTGEDSQLLAEYVTQFSIKLLDKNGDEIINLSDAGKKEVQKVDMQIVYELDGRSYDFEQTITMRNQVLASNIVEVGDSESSEPEEPDASEGPGSESSEPDASEESGSENSEPDAPEESGSESTEIKVTGVSVNVPNGTGGSGGARTTTATITLTGENLPTDAKKTDLLAGVKVTAYNWQGIWIWGSWVKNPSGITISQMKIMSATDRKYEISCEINLSSSYAGQYGNSDCLKLEAVYGDVVGSDTFCFTIR